jgi:tetratricopeptide (TPR) repeat protein
MKFPKAVKSAATAALLLLVSAPAVAQDFSDEFKSALKQFHDKDFARSAAAFRSIADGFSAQHAQADEHRYYCAVATSEAQIYSVLHVTEPITVDVLGPEWCESLFYLAYSDVELGDTAGALEALDQAIALAPFNPHYEVERGFVLRSVGQLDQAMEAYRSASRHAESLGDRTDTWKAISLRGIGSIHAERKNWDEAEKAYRDSLEFEPDNKIALSELQYIKENR